MLSSLLMSICSCMAIFHLLVLGPQEIFDAGPLYRRKSLESKVP